MTQNNILMQEFHGQSNFAPGQKKCSEPPFSGAPGGALAQPFQATPRKQAAAVFDRGRLIFDSAPIALVGASDSPVFQPFDVIGPDRDDESPYIQGGGDEV